VIARVAGGAIGADGFLPNMATEDFLSCLSRRSLEASLNGTSVLPRNKVKDTRKALVEHYAVDRFVHPAALFAPNTEELTAWHKRHAETTSDTEGMQEADADPGDGAPARDDVADDAEGDHLVAAE
jgi:ParB family chromosome partitioning protein